MSSITKNLSIFYSFWENKTIINIVALGHHKIIEHVRMFMLHPVKINFGEEPVELLGDQVRARRIEKPQVQEQGQRLVLAELPGDEML